MGAFPYIDLPQRFGFINLFGILIAGGVLLGTYMGRKYAERNGLDDETLRYFGIRVIIWGFVGAHVFNTIFYEMGAFLEDPWEVTKKLGISSFGAILAGAFAFLFFTWKLKLDRRKWADLSAYGASGGWIFGRLGCALVHDHVGLKTDSPFGVDFPAMKYPWDRTHEIVRAHDLGLYEFYLWVVLIACVVLLERWRGRKPGLIMAFLAISYGVPRFFFEFLRPDITDPRYAGLTFAQWGSIGAFLVGVYLLVTKAKTSYAVAGEGAAVEDDDEPEPPAARAKPASPRKKKKKR